VRDLAWACFSPPLIHIGQLAGDSQAVEACKLEITDERRQWLEKLDRDATGLLQHLGARPTHRLGIYFEHLWHYFLQEDPFTELIAHNLPIHSKGRTLGEFDCIYFCHQRGCHVHLELAVKYFLGLQSGYDSVSAATGKAWVGPDNRDRLDLKLDQLLQRQIRLSDNPVAKPKLQDLGIESMDKEISLKGYLFQSDPGIPPPPPGFNKDAALGYWISCDKVGSHCATLKAEKYMILPKMRWLCAVHSAQPCEAYSISELKKRMDAHFMQDHYPLLVVALDSLGIESSRFFITPEDWPKSNPK
jgi:hypothetical protein